MSIHKCTKCGLYTLKEACPSCKGKALKPAPARFSLVHEQKFGKYRRELMKRTTEKK
ncbi:MAG: ribosome biogenesis protein [Candidatus Heimdallarchaeota archaeon]|nr:ribosome biogenesis protein [Candidatus Heimdallarchaeota archaeon]